jgi:hypothetical protein
MSDAPTLLLAEASFTIEKLDEIVTPASVVSDNDTEKLLSLSCFFFGLHHCLVIQPQYLLGGYHS